MQRVLLAGRGELTMRLIRALRARDIESVTVFSEPEVEQPWVEEADYAVYLNGQTVEETYLNAERLISAAHDAGAVAIHPGYCFLAERADFVAAANAANMRVIGLDRQGLERVADRFAVRDLAHRMGIPTIPAMPLPTGEDGLDQATGLGLPLYVKAVAGGVVIRVDRYEDLPEAVREARRRAEWLTGYDQVYLSGGLSNVRQIGTTVVREPGDRAYALGHSDKSVQVRFRSWLEELGPTTVNAEAADLMSQMACALVETLELGGIARVRWAVSDADAYWLLGVSGRVTTGYSLTEQVFGIDLIDTQLRLAMGDPLGWDGAETEPPRHGIQLRLLHVDPTDGISRPDGVLEKLELPDGVFAEVGVAVGQACTAETEPLLASIVVTAPTRQAAIVKARSVLEDVAVQGVVTNLEPLKGILGDPQFWHGTYDVHMAEAHLG